MSKKTKFVRIEQYEDDFIKMVILGDKETNGASLAISHITINKPLLTPDELAQDPTKTAPDALEQYEDDFIKMVILGDKETNGASLAISHITIKPLLTPDELAQGLLKVPPDAL